MKRLLTAFLLVFAVTPAFSQLQIIPNANAQQLAQKLVGPGVTISNVSITGSTLSSAFFHNINGTQLDLDSGIVLSTGRVQTSGTLYGLNGLASVTASSQTNTPGDPDLAALVAPKPTNDAMILEFDFIPLGDTVKFRYVFSSDEYPTFTCSDFNDVFAFFITGPGITGMQNLAMVPGTTIPVAINSINSGQAGGGYNFANCTGMGPGSPFTQYYIDNFGSPYFTHNGHTTVLTAQSPVQPCQVYHLKIAIADVSDRSYDSGVFLEAGSLTSEPIHILNTLPQLNGLPYMVEGCGSGGITIQRTHKSVNPQPVMLTFGGTVQNGIDVQTIPAQVTIPANDSIIFVPINPIVDNITEGTEVLKIYVSNGCVLNNYFLDSIQIQLRDYDTLALNPSGTVGLCHNATQQLFASGGYTSYQWSPSASLSDATIANPVASPTANTVYTCTATVGTCQARDSVKMVVKILDFISSTNVNCHNSNTGQIKVSGGSEWKQPVQYSINNGSYQADSTFSNLAAGNYMVKIKDASGCVDSMAVSITQAYPDLLLADTLTTASCAGTNGSVQLFGNGGNAPYKYSVDGGSYVSDNAFSVNSGNHMLAVQDANGCVTTKNVVVGTDAPITFTTSASPAACNGSPDGTIYIHAAGGSGQYEYSIDGTNFQSPDSFIVSIPTFTVTVKDDKGCSSSHSVSIPLNQAVYVELGNDTTICEGTSFQVHPNADAANFSWQPAPGLSGYNIVDPIVAPVVSTTYYLTVTRDICVATDSITVNVWPAPVAQAGIDSSICFGRTIQLNGSGGTRFSWTPANAVSDATLAGPSIKPSVTTSYYLVVYDNHNCASLKRDTVVVTVVPAIQVFAGRDTSVTIGQPLHLSGMQLNGSGTVQYQWSPSFGLDDPRIDDPVATLDHDITYTLTITTPEGCEGSDQVNIKVFQGPEIFVPTGFTPNGDGLNDMLKVIPVGMKQLHYFRVFNRWGQTIFSTASENYGWDGKVNGKKQETGTYVWIAEGIDFNGNVIVRKGTTTLIR